MGQPLKQRTHSTMVVLNCKCKLSHYDLARCCAISHIHRAPCQHCRQVKQHHFETVRVIPRSQEIVALQIFKCHCQSRSTTWVHRRPILLQSKLKSASSAGYYLGESPQACLISHTQQNTPSNIKTTIRTTSLPAGSLHAATAPALSVRPQWHLLETIAVGLGLDSNKLHNSSVRPFLRTQRRNSRLPVQRRNNLFKLCLLLQKLRRHNAVSVTPW